MHWMGHGATRAAYPRRLREGYYERYFVGRGLDIGCGACPVTPDCDTWELLHGQDEWKLAYSDQLYDWVYVSHLLEHLRHPAAALQRWWELVAPSGILFIVVPDEDLYEQGVWPSQFNAGHLWSFTIDKKKSWSPASRSLARWWPRVLPDAELLLLERFDTGYDYSGGVWDRTLGDGAEAHIELILRKRG